MPICPNKNLDSWKSLIAALKEKLPKANDADIDAYAHLGFIRKGDGSIPTIEDVNSLVFKNATKTIQADAKEAFKAFKVGKRVGEKATAEEQKQFTKAVSAYLKSVPDISIYVSDTQLKAITRRAVKAVQSEADFAKFTQYFDKVIESAEFSQDVETAKELQKKLKDAFADAAKIVGRLKRVPVEELSPESVKLFNQVAQNFIDSKKPVTSKSYMPFDSQAASNALETISKDVQETFRTSVEESDGVLGLTDEEAEMMDEMMGAEDIDAYLDNLEAAKREDARNNLVRIGQYAQVGLKSKLEFDESAYIDKYSKQDVDNLKAISNFNLSRIQNPKHITEIIRFIDNAVVNNSLADMTSAYAIIDATASAEYLQNLVQKSKTFKIGGLGRVYYDMPIILKSIFGDRSVIGPIRSRTGIDGIGTAASKTEVELANIKKQWDDFIKKTFKDVSGGYSADADLAVGVYADLTNVKADDPDQSFRDNKKQMELSIEALKGSEDEVSKVMGDYLGVVYEATVKDANTSAEFQAAFKEAYPQEAVAAEFAREINNKYLDKLKRHAEIDMNEPFDERLDYTTARSYMVVKPDLTMENNDLVSIFARDILSLRETGRIKERKLKNTLPKNKSVNYQFQNNLFRNLQKQIFVVESYPSARKFKYMSELPQFSSIWGGETNAEYIAANFKQRYDILTFGGKKADELADSFVMDAARISKNIGSALVLGRMTQVVSQSVVLTNAVAQSPEYGYKVLTSNIPTALPLFAEAPILARGVQKGAIGRAEGTEVLAETMFTRGVKSYFKSWVEFSGKGRERIMTPLVAADEFSAKRSFLIYYLKYMNDVAKIPTTVEDLFTEHERIDDVRRDALSYAQQAVEETQAVSERTMMSPFKANLTGSSWVEIARGIIFPFNNFASNAKARMIEDIRKITYGNKNQKKEASVDLAGSVVEAATYNALNVFFIGGVLRFGLNKTFGALFDMEDDEEFYEFMSRKTQRWYTNVTREILASGFGPAAEGAAIEVANRVAFMVAKISGKESRKDYYTWMKEEPLFQPQYKPVQRSGDLVNNILIGSGVYGIAPRAFMEVGRSAKGAATGRLIVESNYSIKSSNKRYEQDMTIMKSTPIRLDDEERFFYGMMAMYKGVAIFTGYSDADITRSLESLQRKVEREKSRSKKGRFSAVR